MGILVPQPGIKPTSPALEDEVLTTATTGKPQSKLLKHHVHQHCMGKTQAF